MTATLARGLSPVRAVLDSGAVVIVQETRDDAGRDDQRHRPCGWRARPADRLGLASWPAASSIAEPSIDRRGAGRGARRSWRLAAVGPRRHTTIVTCTCLSDDFDDVLAIVLDVVRHPVFPEAEFAKRQADGISARSARTRTARRCVRSSTVRDALRCGASVRPPGQGNGRERRADHARRISSRSTPNGSAVGAVAGGRR